MFFIFWVANNLPTNDCRYDKITAMYTWYMRGKSKQKGSNSNSSNTVPGVPKQKRKDSPIIEYIVNSSLACWDCR